jgi:hypothetical protein
MSTRVLTALSMSMLLLCGAARHRDYGGSKGFAVDLATSPKSCGEGSEIVAVAIGRHRARLNAEADAFFPEVVQRLHEVMSNRAEKVVYIKAEAEVPWGEFVELVGDVWSEVNVVSIITPQVESMSRQTYCLSPSCRDCINLGGFPPRKAVEGR